MNPEEVFLIARVFQIKAEKHPKMKIACDKACEFLKALVCDFGKINVDIHLVLDKKFNFHSLSLHQASLKATKKCLSVQQTSHN